MKGLGAVPSIFLPPLCVWAFLTGCSAPKSDTASASKKNIELTIRHSQLRGFEHGLSDLLEDFTREFPHVTVKSELVPWDGGEQYRLYAAGFGSKSDGFDVFAQDVVWISEFADKGWTLDLSDYFHQDDRNDFLIGTIEAATYKGRISAVPWYADAGLLYYRKDLLEKHGRPVPKTWGQMTEASKAILLRENEPGLSGFIWQGKQYEGLVCNAVEFLGSNGVRILDDQGRWGLEPRPRALKALDFMQALIYQHQISPMLVLEADEESSREVFQNGHAIFLRNWPYAISLFSRPGSPIRDKYGIAPLPHFEGQASVSSLGGWFLSVNRFSKHPAEAYELIARLTSAKVQKMLFEKVGYMPTRSALYEDAELLRSYPHLAALGGVFSRATARPKSPRYTQVSAVLQEEISKVLSQSKTPDQALTDMRRRMQPLLE
ncbi:MAG: hypothetical protein A3G41_00905 [Elusimicrobia bacterium RIFCSPLOWO2_12_FULL_59_9]|nr:MAG: hypothetical protein A3G41_00905 [Elusimicrobia bacterium RIFCSPLOWO2_12_FULL_59_9]